MYRFISAKIGPSRRMYHFKRLSHLLRTSPPFMCFPVNILGSAASRSEPPAEAGGFLHILRGRISMKKLSIITLIFAILSPINFLAQKVQNRYEVELFANPNPGRKDTREVNAVLIFDNDSVRIESRRKRTILKEFKFSDIKSVEHSFSKTPVAFNFSTTAIIMTALTGLPIFFLRFQKQKHWLNLVSDKDFAVLKIENDNFRMIKNELAIKNIDLTNIDEDKQ
jgi:hypothetical protein